jgi:amino acid transporter
MPDSPRTTPVTAAGPAELATLRRGSVRRLGVLGQAVSEVGPTAAIAIVIGLIAEVAGNGNWLSWTLALPVFLLAGYCFATMAREHSTTGGLPHLVAKIASPRVGMPVGILLAAFGIVFLPFGLMVFDNYFQSLMHLYGVAGGDWLLIVGGLIGGIGPTYLVYKDVRLAATFMLVAETLSVLLIVVLLVVILARHQGGVIDTSQLTLKGSSGHLILLGAVFSCLTFVGFECTTTFGQEAHNARRTIPFSIYGILIGGGVLFVVAAYTMTLGFQGHKGALATSANPLQDLSDLYGVHWLNYPLQAAVVIGMFAVGLAFLNFAARMLFTYAREGLAPRALGQVDPRTRTPRNAIAVIFAFNMVVFWIMYLAGHDTVAEFGYMASALTLLYLVGYVIALLSIGATGIRRRHVPLAAAALLSTAGFGYIIYNTLSPAPAPPQDAYNYVTLIAAALILAGCAVLAVRRPDIVNRFGSTIDLDTELAEQEAGEDQRAAHGAGVVTETGGAR